MTFASDVKDAVGGVFCAGFNTYDKIARFGAELAYPDRVDSVYPMLPSGKLVAAGTALFCDRPPETSPAPPFLGGQCVTNYRVQATTDRYINGNLVQAGAVSEPGFSLSGPIRDVRISADGAKITVDYGLDLSYDFPSGTGPAGTSRRNLRDITVTRDDGLPDDCGDVAVVYPPLAPGDRTFDIDINNSTGPILFLPPIINVNGDLSVPFNFDVGELNLSGTLELNTGEITLNFGAQPTDPDSPVIPVPDAEPPGAEDDDPEEEKEANIIGVIVVSQRTTDVSATEIPTTTIPTIFVPRIASVAFKIRIRDKGHWTTDLPVKSKNAYIPCPGDIDAIAVGALVEKGWSSVLIPVRGYVPSNQVTLV